MNFIPNIYIQDTVNKKKILTAKKCVDWFSLIQLFNASITIRIVNEDESQILNYKYRGVKRPTNILSFLIDQNPLIGDLILCHPIIKKEARIQKKRIKDHYAHLIIHGYLHLLGYNHEKIKDASIMEEKEVKLLNKLGINNPYESNIKS